MHTNNKSITVRLTPQQVEWLLRELNAIAVAEDHTANSTVSSIPTVQRAVQKRCAANQLSDQIRAELN